MADTQPYRPRKRGYESIKDMMWSLVPIVLLVLGFVYFCGPRDDQATTIDPAEQIKGAQQVVDYPLVAPDGLGQDWSARSATLLRDDDKVTGLSIGYVTPADKMARFVVSSGSRDDVLASALGDDRVVTDPDGEPRALGELSWVPVATYSGRALVAEGDGFVAVVSGTSSYGELYELAGAVGKVAA